MAKFLSLSDEPDDERWTLPEDADVEDVRSRLERAMADGTTARVPVMVAKGQSVELLVNGRVLTAALVWEERSTKPSFTMID